MVVVAAALVVIGLPYPVKALEAEHRRKAS
jgi:hypothetical protein